jgi:hypothetical protein
MRTARQYAFGGSDNQWDNQPTNEYGKPQITVNPIAPQEEDQEPYQVAGFWQVPAKRLNAFRAGREKLPTPPHKENVFTPLTMEERNEATVERNWFRKQQEEAVAAGDEAEAKRIADELANMRREDARTPASRSGTDPSHEELIRPYAEKKIEPQGYPGEPAPIEATYPDKGSYKYLNRIYRLGRKGILSRRV